MTEYEKMIHNQPYDYTDPEIQARIKQTYCLSWRNHRKPRHRRSRFRRHA